MFGLRPAVRARMLTHRAGAATRLHETHASLLISICYVKRDIQFGVGSLTCPIVFLVLLPVRNEY